MNGTLRTAAAAAPVQVSAASLERRTLIEFDRIGVSFGTETVFSDISLKVFGQELVCLLGPSGCGKSTMIRMIGGLIAPGSGTVRVEGKPPDRTRSSIAYVFQSPRLVPWRDALDNVCLGMELRRTVASKAERRERAHRLLEMVGLGNDARKFPAALSGGERQRVAIARALAVEPSIILMDEPFSALDPTTRQRMRRDLVELWQRTAKTIVFATHDLEEALVLADRILVFSDKPTCLLDTLLITEERPRRVEESAPLRLQRDKLLQLFGGRIDVAREQADEKDL